MSTKIAVTVLCGGESTEHDISIQSAMNVIKALNREKYQVSLIYITQEGQWLYSNEPNACCQQGVKHLRQENKLVRVTPCLGAAKTTFIELNGDRQFETDCVFPMLHGTSGEDGCVQGLLQLAHAVSVGNGVLSSSMCMDKDITKQILRAHGVPTTPWVTVTKSQLSEVTYEYLTHTLGEVLFIKPNSLGSSVGVSRVTTQAEFEQALQEGFRFDERLLIEPYIAGREIECAVLGNEEPVAALPAEVTSHHGFYSYQAKYLDPNGATTTVPAQLDTEVIEKIRQLSAESFRLLRCNGMARIDFFLVDDKTVMINEVNTIPGFTDISLYPKMWEASGIPYAKLLDELIELAFARQRELLKLERVYHKPEVSHLPSQLDDGLQ